MKAHRLQALVALIASGSHEIVYNREEEDGTIYCTLRPVKPAPAAPELTEAERNAVALAAEWRQERLGNGKVL